MNEGPFREHNRACPACAHLLRDFHGRLCCDVCSGMMLTLEELKRAIVDMTKIEPSFEYKNEEPGKRVCPECKGAMTTCKLRVVVEDELAKPRPTLDRCAQHGIWFDGEELAAVLAKVYDKVTPKHSAVGWHGNSSGFEWWKR